MVNFSITQNGVRYQLLIVFSLMTIIPFLTFVYFLATYIVPHVATRESVLIVVGLNVLLSLGGLMVLFRIFKSLERFRDYVRAVAMGDLSRPFPASEGTEFVEIAGALQRIVRTLSNDRDQLKDFTRKLEEEVSQRTLDLQQTNLRLSDALLRLTALQEEIIRKNHGLPAEKAK